MTITLLGLVIGWILAGFLGLLAIVILIKIWTGDIDLNYIISDENGWASLSRFQFLIFTFVVAISLFYLIVSSSPPVYPAIPKEILPANKNESTPMCIRYSKDCSHPVIR